MKDNALQMTSLHAVLSRESSSQERSSQGSSTQVMSSRDSSVQASSSQTPLPPRTRRSRKADTSPTGYSAPYSPDTHSVPTSRMALAKAGSAPQAVAGSRILRAESSVSAWHTLSAEFQGIDHRLQRLLDDRLVTDILVQGDSTIWIDRGKGVENTDVKIDMQPRILATRLAAACGKRLDSAAPIVDGVLPGGIRLHAVLPPISVGEAVISLRVQKQQSFDCNTLEKLKMISPALRPLLDAMVASRMSIFISGATGSGKTTLLSALLSLIPRHQRIICIEEANELILNHPHVVYLQERQKNIQGKGEVSMSELVRAAMRMRPDRIVLGECRGSEVREVLSALNTGHEGSFATVHANTAADVPARLCALGALAEMDERAVYAQAGAAIDAVVHIRRHLIRNKIHRWISEIAAPTFCDGRLVMKSIVTCDQRGNVRKGPYHKVFWEKLCERGYQDFRG